MYRPLAGLRSSGGNRRSATFSAAFFARRCALRARVERDGGADPYTTAVEHTPYDDHYPHSEVRVYRGETRVQSKNLRTPASESCGRRLRRRRGSSGRWLAARSLKTQSSWKYATNSILVRKRGFEPPRPCGHKLLRLRKVEADRSRPRKTGVGFSRQVAVRNRLWPPRVTTS